MDLTTFLVVSLLFWVIPLSMAIYNLADFLLEKRAFVRHKNIDWFEAHGYEKRWFGYVKPKKKKRG